MWLHVGRKTPTKFLSALTILVIACHCMKRIYVWQIITKFPQKCFSWRQCARKLPPRSWHESWLLWLCVRLYHILVTSDLLRRLGTWNGFTCPPSQILANFERRWGCLYSITWLESCQFSFYDFMQQVAWSKCQWIMGITSNHIISSH